MEFINNILETLRIPVIVWNKQDNIICVYSNTLLCNKGDDITNYIKNTNIPNYKNYIDNLIDNKLSQNIITIEKNILIEYVNESFFYEIHYIIHNNNDIIYSIIYKLRRPLTNIINILATNANPKDSQIIIKQSCSDMMSIINDLIDILNINKNKLACENRIFHLTNIITDALTYIQNDLEEKKINIQHTICQNINNMYYGDYDKIKQILINILNNCVKYTNIGGIQMDIKEYNSSTKCPFLIIKYPDKINILFKIKDTGVGMNDEIKSYLDSLFNIPSSNSYKKNTSRGFGLYISCHLCKFINGNIWFKSEKDVGTVFYFVIPLQKSA